MSQLPPMCNTEGSISGFSRIETRSQRQSKVLKEHTASNAAPERTRSANFTFTNYFIPVVKNFMPLPELDWADPKEVWSNMLQKDRKYCRDPLYFRKHSFLQPRMRTILLDWLTEVCTGTFSKRDFSNLNTKTLRTHTHTDLLALEEFVAEWSVFCDKVMIACSKSLHTVYHFQKSV